MKHLVVFTALITALTISQAKMNLNLSSPEKYSAIVVQHRTATRNALVRVNVLKIQKPKIFTGNPHKINLFADDREYDIIEVDDVITSYRRKDLNKLEHEDSISDRVRWRLFLARQLAMLKYKEVHS
jgi:hypothetical protein